MADPMEVFAAAVDKAIVKHADSERENQDLKAAIQVAADELLQDVAVELCDAPATAIGVTLLQIYNTGKYGGGLVNPTLHELAEILKDAKDED